MLRADAAVFEAADQQAAVDADGRRRGTGNDLSSERVRMRHRTADDRAELADYLRLDRAYCKHALRRSIRHFDV